MSAFNTLVQGRFNNTCLKPECIRDVIKISGNNIDLTRRFTNLGVSKDTAISVARFALHAFVAVVKKKSRKRVNVNELTSSFSLLLNHHYRFIYSLCRSFAHAGNMFATDVFRDPHITHIIVHFCYFANL